MRTEGFVMYLFIYCMADNRLVRSGKADTLIRLIASQHHCLQGFFKRYLLILKLHFGFIALGFIILLLVVPDTLSYIVCFLCLAYFLLEPHLDFISPMFSLASHIKFQDFNLALFRYHQAVLNLVIVLYCSAPKLVPNLIGVKGLTRLEKKPTLGISHVAFGG